jgi:hypothetical protein
VQKEVRKKLEKYAIIAIYKSVGVRYAHSVFGMKTVREVLAFFDKQFIIVDGVRGLVLKKEYQEYKFTIIQSLKDQFLEYELKYERVKEKRAEISDKERKDYLLISLFKSFIHTLIMIFIYNPNTKLDDMTYDNIKSMVIENYEIK